MSVSGAALVPAVGFWAVTTKLLGSIVTASPLAPTRLGVLVKPASLSFFSAWSAGMLTTFGTSIRTGGGGGGGVVSVGVTGGVVAGVVTGVVTGGTLGTVVVALAPGFALSFLFRPQM